MKINPVTGQLRFFDLDICFGMNLFSSDDIDEALGNLDFLSVGIPATVDSDMRARIEAILPVDIAALARDAITPEEVKALILRHKSIVTELRAAKLIDPGAWDGVVLTMGNYLGRDQISPDMDTQNNGREFEHMKGDHDL